MTPLTTVFCIYDANRGAFCIETVASSERGAIVKWLQRQFGIAIANWEGDAEVWQAFREQGGGQVGEEAAAEMMALRLGHGEDAPSQPEAVRRLLADVLPLLEAFDDTPTLAPGETSIVAPLIARVRTALAAPSEPGPDCPPPEVQASYGFEEPRALR